MDQAHRRSVSLKVVAALFILMGVSDVVAMVVALAEGRLSIQLGVIAIFVGVGLLKLRRGWWIFARISAWLSMIIWAILLPLVLIVPQRGHIRLPGLSIDNPPRWLALLVLLPMLGVCFWVHRVLTRSDVRRLFAPVEPGAFPVKPDSPMDASLKSGREGPSATSSGAVSQT